MASGKHAAKSKSFDDFKFGRRDYNKRQQVEDEEEIEDINTSYEENNNFNDRTVMLNNSGLGANSYNNEDDEEDRDYDDYYDDEKEINYKKVIIVVAVALVVLIAGGFIFKTVNKNSAENNKKASTQTTLPSHIEGYTVLGKIVIDDIKVDQYILASSEDKALKNGIGKIYGSSINTEGNACLAGHNYDKMFGKLSELEVGDTFNIIDRKMQETEYKITKIYSVEPDDLECLMQNDDKKVMMTLITCESGTNKRLIVKAEKVKTTTSSTNQNTVKNSKENG